LNELLSLVGQTALVTGASSGFGWHFAKVLASAGANVVAGARRIDRLEELCKEIEGAGGSAIAVHLDVTDANSVAAAFDKAEQRFGVVSVIINNAGISRSGLLINLQEKDWDAVMDTNLKAVWRVAREATSRISLAKRSGSIVNISSILAFGTGKMLGPYMAAKSGVIQLTRAMAIEWAPLGVRVNALAPGFFPTQMSAAYLASSMGQEMISRIPQRRAGNLDELTIPLLMLASPASSYMTGSVVTVDGGHLCQQL
jgi:NAD(P)-dependent dehydrogenase (short-subunit alcohol dehydrogenase family)